MRHRGETLARLGRTKVIVELRHEHHELCIAARPGGEFGIRCPVQRRRQQDDAGQRMLEAVLQGDLGSERPTHQPGVGQAALGNEFHCRGEIGSFEDAVAEHALRGTAWGVHPAEVEPQNSQIGEGGKPRRRLPQDVRVHEATSGGQRVQGYESGDGVAALRERELADQREAVGGVQLHVLPAGR